MMSYQPETMPSQDGESEGNDGQDQESGEMDTILDPAIARVKQYIKSPHLVTADTLQELLSDLEDAKSYYEDEENEEETSGSPDSGNGQDGKGLSVLIGVGRKK